MNETKKISCDKSCVSREEIKKRILKKYLSYETYSQNFEQEAEHKKERRK